VGVTGGTLAAATGALLSVGTLNVSGGLLKVVDLGTAASLSLGSDRVRFCADFRIRTELGREYFQCLIRQPGFHSHDGHDHVGLSERDG
jgi:hypothetical protein